VVYAARPTQLVSANVSNPIIPYGDSTYNFSGAWTDWNGAGLFQNQVQVTYAPSIASMSVELCLFLCSRDGSFVNGVAALTDGGPPVLTVFPYAGLENGE
jgi:hypothetical protein